jgi:putative transposase
MESSHLLLPDRKYLRHYGYDYSSSGYYAVTICTFRRRYLFGDVREAEMQLSPVGALANHELQRLADRFEGVQLDANVVMPNHIHLILELRGSGDKLGTIVGAYKNRLAYFARQYRKVDRLWQRNYYDHVIRSELSLDKHRHYIDVNPAQWDLDELNEANWAKSIQQNPNIAWQQACL